MVPQCFYFLLSIAGSSSLFVTAVSTQITSCARALPLYCTYLQSARYPQMARFLQCFENFDQCSSPLWITPHLLCLRSARAFLFLPAALASVSFGFVLVRVRLQPSHWLGAPKVRSNDVLSSMQKQLQKWLMSGSNFFSWTASSSERVEGTILPTIYALPIHDFDLRASHVRTLLPAALASVSFGFVLVRVRVQPSHQYNSHGLPIKKCGQDVS